MCGVVCGSVCGGGGVLCVFSTDVRKFAIVSCKVKPIMYIYRSMS